MDHLLAPSSSSSVLGTHHDVFLSFRGEDTRKTFIGHLYKALQQKGIQTFIDSEKLERGEEISPSLIKAIRGSKISIIIFSKNYASSSWCLDELVEILECRALLGQLVWPVFYGVDPSKVRNHTGSFGEALAKYQKTSNKKKEKLPKWKVALYKASNISGWDLNKGDESQLIQKIVEAALKKLNRRHLHVAEHSVGIEDLLKNLESLIDVAKKDVRFIGVYGMGGIGKTTIAKAIFNKFADKFECSSFLANVKETSKQHLGFAQLQETLLFEMLGDKNLKVGNIHRGINIIKERLRNKRVLLILDDVDELDQLQTLAGHYKWFGSGSRIIITTRNRHLLTTHGAHRIYEVRVLDHSRAVELFSWNAFRRKRPVDQDYLALSDRIVRYANGLPLALVVLGSFLYGRTLYQWKSAIHNLENKLDNKIYEILRVSYDALREDEKALFLDTACFFVGEDKEYVIKVLGSSNLCSFNGIDKVLPDMSLINKEGNKIRMHHLIEEVGKEIVCRESLEAGKRSRLWSPNDVFRIFLEDTGTNWIEGIMLKLPERRTLYLNAKSFQKMKRLRLLIFANVVLSTAIEYLPDELRLIDLPGYQFRTLPFNSGPKQLVILNMPDNHIRELDKGFKNFERLKVLNFSRSKFLKKITDLSTAPNLESLCVGHCESLVEIHESVGFLTKLVTLDAQHCSYLSTIPSYLVSKRFKKLDFHGCSRLQIFPNLVEKIELLESLNLSGTGIKELLPSFCNLYKLSHLSLAFCRQLRKIPELPEHLINLNASHCKSLVETPWKIMAKIISSSKRLLRDSEIVVTLSGSDIPDWFSHKSLTNSVTFDVPLNVMKNMAAVIICAVSGIGSRNKETTELSFKLLHESYTGTQKTLSETGLRSLRRKNIWIERGNMWLIFLPASTLLSECLPYSPSYDTKTSVLKKTSHVNKIKGSFDDCSSISRCGMHVLLDGQEFMIDGKRIKVSDSFSRIIDRTFDIDSQSCCIC